MLSSLPHFYYPTLSVSPPPSVELYMLTLGFLPDSMAVDRELKTQNSPAIKGISPGSIFRLRCVCECVWCSCVYWYMDV